ncbi:MAG: maleylpyruvate isomerase family mycothiol-dependent enzyme [Ilumatobacteraceae bacterium]
MSEPPSIGELYLASQQSFAEFACGLGEREWRTPVGCCPGWTVRDVLSHVAGLADDLVAGRVEGAATDPWTAVQVERWRDAPVDELLAQWESQAPTVAELLDQLGEIRPPIDCCSHEHDVRAALGRPGNRDSAVIEWALAGIATASTPNPVEIVLRDGRRFPTGAGTPGLTVSGLDPFEVFRSRLGRRSATQVRAYDWSAPPTDDVLGGWFLFGPNDADIHE